MRVLFAYDGSAFAKRALAYAERLGPDLEAIVVTVSPVLLEAPRTPQSAEPDDDARRQLDDAHETLAAAGVEAEALHRFGNPAAELIAVAEERGADLIVMGQRGRSAIARFIEGSVTDRVVRHAGCDVLVVR